MKSVDGNSTLTLGYLIAWEQGWLGGPVMGSAIILGVEEVYRRNLLPGYQIEWVLRDDYCEPRRGMQVTVDIWDGVEHLHGFIGSLCGVVCQPQSLLAASLNIAVIGVCTPNSLSDKDVYPTFTRVEGTYIAQAPGFDRLVDVFGWKKVGIIYTPENVYKDLSAATLKEMERNGKEVILQVVESTVKGDQMDVESLNDLRKAMDNMKSQVRVFLMFTYSVDLRNMLITALDLDMMNGEYVFITTEFTLDIIGTPQTYRPEADEFIYEALMAIGVVTPSGPQYDNFRQQVIDQFQDPRFDHLPTLPPDASIDEVNVYAGTTFHHLSYHQ